MTLRKPLGIFGGRHGIAVPLPPFLPLFIVSFSFFLLFSILFFSSAGTTDDEQHVFPHARVVGFENVGGDRFEPVLNFEVEVWDGRIKLRPLPVIFEFYGFPLFVWPHSGGADRFFQNIVFEVSYPVLLSFFRDGRELVFSARVSTLLLSFAIVVLSLFLFRKTALIFLSLLVPSSFFILMGVFGYTVTPRFAWVLQIFLLWVFLRYVEGGGLRTILVAGLLTSFFIWSYSQYGVFFFLSALLWLLLERRFSHALFFAVLCSPAFALYLLQGKLMLRVLDELLKLDVRLEFPVGASDFSKKLVEAKLFLIKQAGVLSPIYFLAESAKDVLRLIDFHGYGTYLGYPSLHRFSLPASLPSLSLLLLPVIVCYIKGQVDEKIKFLSRLLVFYFLLEVILFPYPGSSRRMIMFLTVLMFLSALSWQKLFVQRAYLFIFSVLFLLHLAFQTHRNAEILSGIKGRCRWYIWTCLDEQLRAFELAKSLARPGKRIFNLNCPADFSLISGGKEKVFDLTYVTSFDFFVKTKFERVRIPPKVTVDVLDVVSRTVERGDVLLFCNTKPSRKDILRSFEFLRVECMSEFCVGVLR